MVKRLISANTSEMLKMNGSQLKQSIKASEGRVVLSENVALHEPLDGITTSEIAASFGADLILLNALDVLNPIILGLYPDENNLQTAKAHHDGQSIKRLQKLVGRPIGVNLEPVDPDAKMAEDKTVIPEGRMASKRTLQEAENLGFNFVVLTGNPGTGVTNQQIAKNIKVAKEVFSGLIIAGKMHGAGVDEAVVSEDSVHEFLEAGADVILVPAVGTVPGFSDNELQKIVQLAHKKGALVMSTIGTSQEGSGKEFIQNVAIRNKIAGVDIQHIGDAAWGIQSPFENIYALSKTIRGERHAIARMARSINR
ncbi:haloacid dehalogenase-like hydrolase [Companilactobacillus halodurans]|uniref:Haloacid dehalogenase-like hydrolase n=1 Tax=Companilactobacillus halodurans TaxID=2584183 RepID=A0A5P0ZYB6_9LACO|nr:haloacid dehalogenase-like hydrolase [Companilactobacillus halodurans]MQS76637.1 haloacid dehalogenase-like hydrolase [Companilactobacillus halodurans]MQS97802.1 haloacid dehalogenase-like hydrolase [Companilactobacillus halodurans]